MSGGSIGSVLGTVVGNAVLPGVGGAIGGALGGALSGGSGSSSANNSSGPLGGAASTYSKNPNWVNDASQQVYNQGAAAAAVPYQAYTGPRVADVSQSQQYANRLANASAGALEPEFDQAYNLYKQGATPYTPTYTPTDVGYNNVGTQDFTKSNITGYMNPYLQASLQPQINNINQAYSQRQNDENARAAGAGVFGGSRAGVNSALITKQQQDELNGVIGQGYNTAFNSAASNYQTDQSRQLQADLANQQAGIGTGEFNANQQAGAFKTNADIAAANRAAATSAAGGINSLIGNQQGIYNSQIGNLMNTGALAQNQQQQQQNVDYQNFLEQRGYSKDQATYLNNLLKGNPASGSIQGMQGVLGNSNLDKLTSAAIGLSDKTGLTGAIGGLFGSGTGVSGINDKGGAATAGSDYVSRNLGGYNGDNLPSTSSPLYNPDNLTGFSLQY